ncbi:MAG: glycosyltransferase family 2 protein [Verrucomicrobiales bacterium]
MNEPFFSILLPTKNRSQIVGDAVASALRQTFGDFELIVSDNDDSDTATRDAVAQYKDPRIRYFRTSGKLPMHENWENALSQARGKHILILEDKMRLASNALSILKHYLDKHGNIVISYDVKFEKNPTMPDPVGMPDAQWLQSKDVAEMFCRFEQDFFTVLPKSLDSCAPRETVMRAKAKSPTGLFFSYVTPDYSSGFKLLGEVDKFLMIRQPLVCIPNNWMWQGKFSVGQSSYKKENLTQRWLNELPVTPQQIQDLVPVKCQWLWINNVHYDFHTQYRRSDHKPEVNWVEYHAFCYVIVATGIRLKADMSADREAIWKSLRPRSIGFKMAVFSSLAKRLLALGLGTALKKKK